MKRKQTVATTASVVMLSGLALGTAAPVHASTASATPGSQLSQNLPEPTDLRTVRSIPGDPKLVFYWGLKRDDDGAISRLAAVSDPASANYRQFQSAKATARNFGASRATVKTVRSYLKKKGVKGKLDSSRLFLRVVGKADEMERAFGTVSIGESDGIAYYGISDPKKIKKKIRKLAPERIWAGQKQIALGSGSDRVLTRKLPTGSQPNARALDVPLNKGTFIGCEAIDDTLLPLYSMTFPQGSKAYGINNVRSKVSKRGDIATRPPIGIISMGSGYSDNLVAEAKACFGFKGSVRRIETDGLQQLPSGGEGNLDVQAVLTALMSSDQVPVFESIGAPAMFLGPAAALTTKRPPTVLSISYGECEPQTPKPTRTLADAVYQRLGLIGTSVMAASGDRGSSGCINNDTGTGPTKAAVSYPASSPWVTGVGGTRIVLKKSNKRKKEFAWNDSTWGQEVGGGGGVSVLYSRPSWQAKSVTGGKRRSVPDISAHASLFPGWFVFGEGVIGGTSAATPLSASGVALVNAHLSAKGQPALGLLNPLLYSLPSSATHDITKGNTDLHDVGCCTAKKGYDRATGIGSPNFAKWPKAIRQVR